MKRESATSNSLQHCSRRSSAARGRDGLTYSRPALPKSTTTRMRRLRSTIRGVIRIEHSRRRVSVARTRIERCTRRQRSWPAWNSARGASVANITVPHATAPSTASPRTGPYLSRPAVRRLMRPLRSRPRAGSEHRVGIRGFPESDPSSGSAGRPTATARRLCTGARGTAPSSHLHQSRISLRRRVVVPDQLTRKQHALHRAAVGEFRSKGVRRARRRAPQPVPAQPGNPILQRPLVHALRRRARPRASS